MAKKKHQINCGKCGGACEWYKKGKGHRVLVCQRCGIIASNPIPLLAAAGAALAPSAIEWVGSKIFKKKEPLPDEETPTPPTTKPRLSVPAVARNYHPRTAGDSLHKIEAALR